MTRFHRHLSFAVLFSEFSHVFCCVLPTVVSVLSFAANLGLITVMPGFLIELHHHIHEYEGIIITGSGFFLIAGWAAFWIGRRLVVGHRHDSRIVEEAASALTSRRILLLATLLFAVNFSIYLVVHKNVFHLPYFKAASVTQDPHDTRETPNFIDKTR